MTAKKLNPFIGIATAINLIGEPFYKAYKEVKKREDEKRLEIIKEKIKFFHITIQEGFLWDKVKLTLRDNPLTDEEVNVFIKMIRITNR
jgi:hypothetical protein